MILICYRNLDGNYCRFQVYINNEAEDELKDFKENYPNLYNNISLDRIERATIDELIEEIEDVINGEFTEDYKVYKVASPGLLDYLVEINGMRNISGIFPINKTWNDSTSRKCKLSSEIISLAEIQPKGAGHRNKIRKLGVNHKNERNHNYITKSQRVRRYKPSSRSRVRYNRERSVNNSPKNNSPGLESKISDDEEEVKEYTHTNFYVGKY